MYTLSDFPTQKSILNYRIAINLYTKLSIQIANNFTAPTQLLFIYDRNISLTVLCVPLDGLHLYP